MREPGMGESVYYIRRALYELRYREGRTDGVTEPELLNYAKSRGWPMPVRNFNAAMLRLKRLGRATDTGGGDVLATLYRLTPDGELEARAADLLGPCRAGVRALHASDYLCRRAVSDTRDPAAGTAPK